MGSSARSSFGFWTSAPRDGHPLLLAAGEAVREVGGAVQEPHLIEEGERATRGLAGRGSESSAGSLDVLEHGQGGD